MADVSASERGRALIVVVERDPHVRALERYFLERAGFTVEFCDDGLTALHKVRELVPNIVISEVLVPRLDGLALCREVKSDPATRHISVLIFSILLSAERAAEAGADAFMRKPLDDERLIDSVERLLRRERELRDGADHERNP